MPKVEVAALGAVRIFLAMVAQIIMAACAVPVHAQKHRPVKTICINVNINDKAYFAQDTVNSNFLANQEGQIAAHIAQYIDAALDGRASQNIKVSGESTRTNNSLGVINCKGESIKILIYIRPIARKRGINEVVYDVKGKRNKKFRFVANKSYNFAWRGPQDPYGGVLNDVQLQANAVAAFIKKEI